MELSQQVNKSGGDLPGPEGSCRWGLRCWHNKALRDSTCRAQPCSTLSMCPRDPFAGLSPPASVTKTREEYNCGCPKVCSRVLMEMG